NSPTAKDYPDSDAIVLKHKIFYELAPDGKISEKVSRIEKVLTYQGLDHIGDPLISFNKENQTFEVKKLRTYTKEGRIIDAKQNSFTEMTPFELEKSPDYTNIRQMVLTKVGMDLESVVETEYEIKDIKPYKKNLEKVILFCEDIPVLEKEIEIKVPASKELKIKLFNANENLSIKEEGNYKIYSVILKNLPRLYHSECSNGEEYLTPFVVFTTAPNWAEQSKNLYEMFARSIKDKPQSLKEKVDKLTEKNVSQLDKVKSVHDFVVSKYRTIEWNLSDFDYSSRNISRIFETRYGNVIDKAVLLGGMVETLGFKPEYYLFSENPAIEFAEAVPSVSMLDKVALSVIVDGKKVFLSPTAPLEEFSLKNLFGKKVLNLGEGESRLTQIADQNVENKINFKAILEASENFKLKGTSTIVLSGDYVNYESFVKSGVESEISSLISSIVVNSEEIKVKVLEFTSDKIEAAAEFAVDLKKDAEKKKVFAALITSFPQISLIKEFEGKSRRNLPKIVSKTGEESYEISFSVPDGLRLFNIPKNSNCSGVFKIFQKAQTGEKNTTLAYGISIPKKQISQKDYEETSKCCANLVSDASRVFFFEEAKKK
ncbi:MAG: DUF3857 domain-containing protein, partial [Acidobacteria bacterium]|nr:DUF3857 domain-containing protein [Acidobacteriota bacterium]